MAMNGVLKKSRLLSYQQKLPPSKFDTQVAKVRYVTKKKRKEIQRGKEFEAERDSLWTPEEFEDLSH